MRPSRQRRLALLFAAVLVPVTALLVGPVATASAATLFSDDFTDGDTAGWSKSGGTWESSPTGPRPSGSRTSAARTPGSSPAAPAGPTTSSRPG